MNIDPFWATFFVVLGGVIGKLIDFFIGRQRNQLEEKIHFIDDIQEEILRLQTRVTHLEKQNYDLLVKMAELQAENGRLQAENEWLKEKVSKMEQNN
ncbi:hypothetical protein AM501_12140 [Aneurinibacillus migulanus]|jgi:predicted RNase H-like nuclease (RuvC/YqgF family)|uniref:Uncharacterized protein n=1 Tax=Aneurinibacillus migulanus TaxID=47500 RepID=A0A0D1XJR8_ANEMI|nr:hypothetical protein [Aneurinibacillus migulanus]KIV51783.1 hypothetical protein TS65_24700 [Aneurinibacillus migulanus]KIV54516.1 hypothetical protein TS64_15910 [Aneurinibacillus migulanus]KON97900.1 hypothetical protein AF333_23180 [Aneurinibacillus migulanus]KPD08088.1 hypothetical protein AM501_12140 [Aneurinibacillus migulanus]MCP1354056.1 hypothetical protein [Aneurinibacillus migulanus]